MLSPVITTSGSFLEVEMVMGGGSCSLCDSTRLDEPTNFAHEMQDGRPIGRKRTVRLCIYNRFCICLGKSIIFLLTDQSACTDVRASDKRTIFGTLPSMAFVCLVISAKIEYISVVCS